MDIHIVLNESCAIHCDLRIELHFSYELSNLQLLYIEIRFLEAIITYKLYIVFHINVTKIYLVLKYYDPAKGNKKKL